MDRIFRFFASIIAVMALVGSFLFQHDKQCDELDYEDE